MRIFVFAMIVFFTIGTAHQSASAQESMCESVQKHIRTAKSIGGEPKAKEKITQIFGAHKYLKKSISEPELVRCIFLSGIDPNFIKAEAVSAGISNEDVQAVYVTYRMSLPPDERGAVSLVRHLEQGDKEDVSTSDVESTLSLDVIAKDASVEGGVSSGPGCNQISPWTWCAY